MFRWLKQSLCPHNFVDATTGGDKIFGMDRWECTRCSMIVTKWPEVQTDTVTFKIRMSTKDE